MKRISRARSRVAEALPHLGERTAWTGRRGGRRRRRLTACGDGGNTAMMVENTMNVGDGSALLISTTRWPAAVGLASAAAWLRAGGWRVEAIDARDSPRSTASIGFEREPSLVRTRLFRAERPRCARSDLTRAHRVSATTSGEGGRGCVGVPMRIGGDLSVVDHSVAPTRLDAPPRSAETRRTRGRTAAGPSRSADQKPRCPSPNIHCILRTIMAVFPVAARPYDDPFFGHPRGCPRCSSPRWGAFSYYGMRARVILFMTRRSAGGPASRPASPGAVYGLYTSMVYMTTCPAAGLPSPDRAARAVLYGASIIAAGHFSMASRR